MYLPWARYTMARLLRVWPTSGWFVTERLLPDRQRALEEPLSLGVLALVSIHEGQIVEGLGHVRVACTQRLFPDRQRALVESLRLAVLALPPRGQARLWRA